MTIALYARAVFFDGTLLIAPARLPGIPKMPPGMASPAACSVSRRVMPSQHLRTLPSIWSMMTVASLEKQDFSGIALSLLHIP